MSLEGSHLLSEFAASCELSGHACHSGPMLLTTRPGGQRATSFMFWRLHMALGCPSPPIQGASNRKDLVDFFFFILTIMCIILCLQSWQSALQCRRRAQLLCVNRRGKPAPPPHQHHSCLSHFLCFIRRVSV